MSKRTTMAPTTNRTNDDDDNHNVPNVFDDDTEDDDLPPLLPCCATDDIPVEQLNNDDKARFSSTSIDCGNDTNSNRNLSPHQQQQQQQQYINGDGSTIAITGGRRKRSSSSLTNSVNNLPFIIPFSSPCNPLDEPSSRIITGHSYNHRQRDVLVSPNEKEKNYSSRSTTPPSSSTISTLNPASFASPPSPVRFVQRRSTPTVLDLTSSLKDFKLDTTNKRRETRKQFDRRRRSEELKRSRSQPSQKEHQQQVQTPAVIFNRRGVLKKSSSLTSRNNNNNNNNNTNDASSSKSSRSLPVRSKSDSGMVYEVRLPGQQKTIKRTRSIEFNEMVRVKRIPSQGSLVGSDKECTNNNKSNNNNNNGRDNNGNSNGHTFTNTSNHNITTGTTKVIMKGELWFQPDEYEAIKKKTMAVVKAVKGAGGSANNIITGPSVSVKYCTRGLEKHFHRDCVQDKYDAVDSVLKEQDCQRQRDGYFDEDRLRQAYSERTKRSSIEALARAKLDSEEAIVDRYVSMKTKEGNDDSKNNSKTTRSRSMPMARMA